MSGILGLYNRDDQPLDQGALAAMLAALAYRGPDGTALWSDAIVGLGHCMRWTTPESLHERLSFVQSGSEPVITADARLDNRAELIAALRLREHPEHIADSQIILAAYECWSEACPAYLLGDFAFAIWDSHKQMLFCARDHFGVKPFFYTADERRFAFASELRGILALPNLSRDLDETWVAAYLTSTGEDMAATPYAAIRRLPASHALTISATGIRQWRYWALDGTRDLQMASDAAYAEAFRSIFAEAVRCRMRSAFPVGATLSGGLDSSSVACVARELQRTCGAGPLPTFSARFEKVLVCSEAIYIDAALAQGGMQPFHVVGEQLAPWETFAAAQFDANGPISGGNSALIWSLYNVAQQQSVRVVLDGFDGDSVVSHGTGRIVELARAGRWWTFWRETKGYTRHFDDPTWQVMWPYLWRYGLDPLVPDGVRPLARGMLAIRAKKRDMQPPAPQPYRGILNAGFARRLNWLEQRAAARLPAPETEREHHLRVLNNPAITSTLEQHNRMAATAGIEDRHPFWDRRLVEFCLALPAEQKLRGGLNRWIMRNALKDVLPRAIQQRGGKTNMAPSFAYAFHTFEQARLAWAVDHLDIIADIVDADEVRSLYTRFRDQHASADDIGTLWRIGSFAVWLHNTTSESQIAMRTPHDDLRFTAA